MRRFHQSRSRFRPLGGFLVLAAGIAVWGAADAAAASVVCEVDQPDDDVNITGTLRYCVDQVNQGLADQIDIVVSGWYELQAPLVFERPALVVGGGALVSPGDGFVGSNLLVIGTPCPGPQCNGIPAVVELVRLELAAMGFTGVRGIELRAGHELTLTQVQLADFSVATEGGCVRAGLQSQLTVAQSLLYGCSAGDGGAIFSSAETTSIVESELADNVASWNGGAVAIGVGGFFPRTLDVVASSLHGNAATWGGAIKATSTTVTATATGSEFIANAASESGGAVYGKGVYDGCLFQHNGAETMGGGLHATENLTVRDSTLDGNVSLMGGGAALFGSASLAIEGSTLVGNYAKGSGEVFGAGVLVGQGNAFITNSTFSENVAIDYQVANARGGGLAVLEGGIVLVEHSTFGDNVADDGGGIFSDIGSKLVLRSSMLAYSAGNDCTILDTFDTDTSMDSDGSCNVAFGNVDPGLLPLAANGGPTLTREPQDGFDVALCYATVDQRGEPRPASDCDIGALERQ